MQLQRVEFKSSGNMPCRLKPMDKMHLDADEAVAEMPGCRVLKCSLQAAV